MSSSLFGVDAGIILNWFIGLKHILTNGLGFNGFFIDPFRGLVLLYLLIFQFFLENSFDFFVKFWPHYLPKGFIHGDLFPDNVFFINDKITGVIDFYFSCTDILTYDLAIAINAWCFDKQYNFQDKKYQALLKGYNSKRKLSKDEEFFLPLLCQAASLRFLLTRLFDWVNTPIEANVVLKNPEEYITKHKHFKKLVKNIKYVEN